MNECEKTYVLSCLDAGRIIVVEFPLVKCGNGEGCFPLRLREASIRGIGHRATRELKEPSCMIRTRETCWLVKAARGCLQ